VAPPTDHIGVVDVGLTIPGLMVLITPGHECSRGSVHPTDDSGRGGRGLAVPARVIRAQVLSARERVYIDVARLSAMSTPAIIVKEVLPNLMPYIVASLVGSVSRPCLPQSAWSAGLGSFDSLTIA